MTPIWAQLMKRTQRIGSEAKRIATKNEIFQAWQRWLRSEGRIPLRRAFIMLGYNRIPDNLSELVGKKLYRDAIKRFSRRPTRLSVGINNERKTKNTFELHGWYVMRSAGSKGLWDLFVLNMNPPHDMKLLQIKSGSGVSGKKRIVLEQFQVPSFLKKELWEYEKGEYIPKILQWDGLEWIKQDPPWETT